MARRVDPRRLRRPSSALPLDDTPDPLAQLAAEPYRLPFTDRNAHEATYGPLATEARRLRGWGGFLVAAAVLGGVVATLAGGLAAANGSGAYGVGVIAGGVAAAVGLLWLRTWHDAAAAALEAADRACTVLENQADLLRQIAQHAGGAGDQR